MTLVADKKKEIRVFRMGAAVRAEAMIGACAAYLQKIFIVSKKSWMINLPEYAEMIGNDMSDRRGMPRAGYAGRPLRLSHDHEPQVPSEIANLARTIPNRRFPELV